MSSVREYRVSRTSRSAVRPARRGLVLLAAAAVLVSACGSGDDASSSGASDASATTAPVAGASENAVVSGAVCYEWPSGTAAMPCAVGLKGPGGGRVFYDAGSEQPWGRFLEVAPQNWGGTLNTCSPKSCGAAGAAIENKTTDYLQTNQNFYVYPCRASKYALSLPGEAGDTLWEIGGGRHNTEVLRQTPECVDGTTSALTRVTGYRTDGASDWYLPSGGELTALCKYTGRNAIGGFINLSYVSSTVGPMGRYTNFFSVDFAGAPGSCVRGDVLYQTSNHTDPDKNTYEYDYRAFRPIRAFS